MRALVTGGTKGVGFEIVKSMIQNNIPTLFTGRNLVEIKEAETKQNQIQPNFAIMHHFLVNLEFLDFLEPL